MYSGSSVNIITVSPYKKRPDKIPIKDLALILLPYSLYKNTEQGNCYNSNTIFAAFLFHKFSLNLYEQLIFSSPNNIITFFLFKVK